MLGSSVNREATRPLYTPEERRRRDSSVWTIVQGVLAPLQFAVFLVSLVLVIRYLWTGLGYEAAVWSIVAKTALLYTIMVTGSIWEKKVFGVWLFAHSFFWEDVFSFVVLALHTAYLVVLLTDAVPPQTQMIIALAGYAAYVINAGQFLLKLRAARLSQPATEDLTDNRMEAA
ncbi:MAG: 2-vinyl bacteriochlorophyllide hydratase [Alphaproteobacteria bacterium]|nr:2-vinyl bacteriochlorophyllide hydratase [Alphaproteobacteria bacterium]